MKLKRDAIFFAILLLIFLACAALWLWAGDTVAHIASGDGTRDLRGADFDSSCFDLYGPVEYIPNALLTPNELEARQDEIQTGEPAKTARYSTSRLRIYVPAETYGLMLWNAEFATNIYINGQLIESVGVPASDSEHSTPGVRLLYYTADAPNGVIEIVQQAANHTLPEGGGHSDIIIGKPETVLEVYSKHKAIPSVVMGCFLALALAHLVLYSLLRFYKANLWFALFCLTWFIRTGYTDPWLLSSLLPLPWAAVFRLCCLTYPAGLLLLCLTLSALFPGILQKWFRIALAAVCGVFACVCLFAGTVFLSHTMPYFYAIIFVTSAYALIRLCVKVRELNVEQIAVLVGMGIFLFGALRDILSFKLDFLFPSTGSVVGELTEMNMAEFALLVFVFFQMAAMFRGTMREIAAAREAEQKLALENAALESANHLKADIMATISHETRTPIAVISNYTELIAMELRAQGVSEQHAKDLDTVSDEIQRIGRLMDDMQSLSRSRSEDARKAMISLSDVIRQTARLYAHILERRNTSLTVELPESLPPVFANPGEMTQVLLNLLQNAGKHTENGIVKVCAEAKGKEVIVTVTDTGEGIATELLPRVFERGVSGKENGTGIGLAVCRDIIKAHGGEIGIESRPGEGTIVRFTLPAGWGGRKMAEQKTVLLVEDNERLNESNRRALKLKGYRVLTALTLREAREHLKNSDPDVILLDVMLPDGDGIDFCGEIYNSVTSHILFLTAKAEQENRIKGLEYGGDDYITKPFKLEEMLARVGAAMRRREKEAGKPPAQAITRGPLTPDVVAGRALLNGEDMQLTQKEFGVLFFLARNVNKIMTKEQIYEEVWKAPLNNDSGSLWRHVSSVKKKSWRNHAARCRWFPSGAKATCLKYGNRRGK